MVKILDFLAARTDRLRVSEVRDLLRWITEDVISFGGGLPDPSTFPTEEEIREIFEFIQSVKSKAFQYGLTEGLLELREEIVRFSRNIGVKTDVNRILITTGSQQALEILARIFINQRDVIVVELPTYVAAIQAFSLYRPHYIGIPMDYDGLRTDLLEEELKNLKKKGIRPKFLYTIPTCQNPAGLSMSNERRKHLLELASQYDFFIVEDDPYSYILFEPIQFKRLKAMDSEGRVIYVSTFSKIFAPGLRVGWVIANEDIIKYMGLAKQGMDLCTSPFAQYVVLYALKSGIIEKRLPIISRLYKRKRDLMLEELENHLSDYAEWTKPVGGMFIFMWLPKQVDTKRMLLKAIKKYKIAYVPGRSFFVDGSGWNTMRLNFTYPSEEQIREGVKRLTMAIKDELKEIGVEQRV